MSAMSFIKSKWWTINSCVYKEMVLRELLWILFLVSSWKDPLGIVVRSWEMEKSPLSGRTVFEHIWFQEGGCSYYSVFPSCWLNWTAGVLAKLLPPPITQTPKSVWIKPITPHQCLSCKHVFTCFTCPCSQQRVCKLYSAFGHTAHDGSESPE